jgi:hypothetical protein
MKCRIRHVKCDEEKPACNKCYSTGRKCDGYLLNIQRRTQKNEDVVPPSSPGLSVAKLVHARQLSIATILSPDISGTTQERRCFEYFRYEIGQELSIAMNLDRAHHFVLQASHSDDAIKSAVIAIGSMGHRLRVNTLLTSENQQANALQDFAQSQYCKALKILRAQICNDPAGNIDLAIMSCFLFTIFEFLQGNDAGALVHLRSGLNILQREDGTCGSTLNQDLLRQEIIRIFSIMDMSATRWLGLKSFQSSSIMPLETLEPAPMSLNHFMNMNEAASSLGYHMSRMYHFRRWANFHGTTPDNKHPSVYIRHQDLMMKLERWPMAMDSFLNTSDQAALSVEELHRISVMQMNYLTTIIENTLCMDRPDEPHTGGRFDTEFLQIISLGKSIILPMNDVTRSRVERIVAANNGCIDPVPLFSFFAGIIHPLFFVAITCRKLSLAQEAVLLLSSKPWREGAWDSATMAGIAEKKIRQLQTEGCYDDVLHLAPDHHVDLPLRSLCNKVSSNSVSATATQYLCEGFR